ncbi:probable trehalase isoform X2 [Selaginella moellendorffii]|uniref:probable trehalase isoform X2 n=1 Tax=Selaginella moellendorffii TaxID=88036 RepID=UPI000D1CB4C5|nr:probable trehalase isoform X2 [Selaginella moellendorffii]|eukprot:XP_024529022.1 probable trehalase isoform X2 [Selaginella moellendorffii]
MAVPNPVVSQVVHFSSPVYLSSCSPCASSPPRRLFSSSATPPPRARSSSSPALLLVIMLARLPHLIAASSSSPSPSAAAYPSATASPPPPSASAVASGLQSLRQGGFVTGEEQSAQPQLQSSGRALGSISAMEEIPCCNGCYRTPVVMRNHTDLESFLVMIQNAALQVEGDHDFDPKVYVDLPLKHSLPSTKEAFVSLFQNNNGSVDTGEFNHFLNEFCDKPGSDLLPDNLTDFKNEPEGFLANVTNPAARDFALKMHSLWWLLARKVKERVHKDPHQHTLIPLPNPVVVPGARFREVYYWDTYWIVRGLLVSKLYETARNVVENLMFLANSFGFIPNGARTYYTNRSQPPLLSEAVMAIYHETKDVSFVEKAFPALLKEHNFWCADPHRVHIRDANGVEHVLTRYYAMWDEPRPESSTIDMQIAKGLERHQRAELYHHIATAAESGWDFSSRWMEDRHNLKTMKTSFILPVDLNAFLVQMENNIALFAKLLGKSDYEKHFYKLANSRKIAMDAILWNEEMGQYLDYWLVKRNAANNAANYKAFEVTYDFLPEHHNTDAYPSNFIPLWCGVVPPGDRKIQKMIASFKESGLLLPAGITTSLLQTGQQWDYPNAWAPLQHMIIEGFALTENEEGIALAKDISRRWLETNYVGYLETGEMQEKYDARYCGKVGSGGEYLPQAGFGWSNGVVLSLFERFGWAAEKKLTCE